MGGYCFRSSMPKFFIKTYDCQVNQRDSEQDAHSLLARGYDRDAHDTEARVLSDVLFSFIGCMDQARGESLLKNLPHVDLVVGTQKFHRVADYVEELVAKKTARAAIAPDQNRAMDDVRFSIVDTAEEPGSQSTIRDQQLAPRQT